MEFERITFFFEVNAALIEPTVYLWTHSTPADGESGDYSFDDYASYNYSDFWVFTHKKRVSHDKISDFTNLHGAEMKTIFSETIILADRNELLNFDTIFQDGFLTRHFCGTG